jgi:hypothetical protein
LPRSRSAWRSARRSRRRPAICSASTSSAAGLARREAVGTCDHGSRDHDTRRRGSAGWSPVVPRRLTSGRSTTCSSPPRGERRHRHGLPWSAAPFQAWRAPQRHLPAADGERSFVALDGRRLASFSAALARGDTWLLAALFVSPEYQGQRVGPRTADRSGAGDHQRRMTITNSIQPVSRVPQLVSTRRLELAL